MVASGDCWSNPTSVNIFSPLVHDVFLWMVAVTLFKFSQRIIFWEVLKWIRIRSSDELLVWCQYTIRFERLYVVEYVVIHFSSIFNILEDISFVTISSICIYWKCQFVFLIRMDKALERTHGRHSLRLWLWQAHVRGQSWDQQKGRQVCPSRIRR